jgi:predicted nucleic acid-binding protein
MVKIFLDTNIIMDFLEIGRKRHFVSSTIIMECLKGNLKGCLSETLVTNCSYLLRKEYSQQQFNEIFLNFSKFFEFHGINNGCIKKACEVNIHDLEDAILYQIALENNCQYFITSNVKDFIDIEQPKLKVVSPEEFLEWYEKDY